ncbi:MAG: isocitrate lyase/PEP mutase family protein [Burkholderiaceae bacterium]
MKTLREKLQAGTPVVAPGVYDMFSARIADRMPFEALYMTGYGISGSYLGLADAGIATYTDMVSRAGTIAKGTSKPLMADADTGYGGLLNVHHTVRGYEAAGVQAIQIEDQENPKKCGHTPNRRVVSRKDAIRRIEVAASAKTKDQTLIIARTDSRSSLGLDEAIARGKDFLKAGADIVFVESPETEDEFKKIGESIDGWLFANMVPSGRSPEVDAKTLHKWGFDIVIHPAAGMMYACGVLQASYEHLLKTGKSGDAPLPKYDMAQLHNLMGFEEVWAFEKKWAED